MGKVIDISYYLREKANAEELEAEVVSSDIAYFAAELIDIMNDYRIAYIVVRKDGTFDMIEDEIE